MEKTRFSIFRRISILVFTLITSLCILFIAITYLSLTSYHEASTQLLNKEVAAHIAKFTSPFENDSINTKKADSVFYNAMVLSPAAEVYFLDTTGKIIAYHASESAIKLWTVPLENITKLIASKGERYIKNPDPKNPSDNKIFSAVAVKGKSAYLGYIYVVLASNKSVSDMLYSGYVSNFLVKVFFVIILFSIIVVFIYLKRIERSFADMMAILLRFQNGDLEARFKIKEHNELSGITEAFNQLADLLVLNINKLKKSENERKDFIANISHDLRTPLSIARGYTETVLFHKQEITGKQEHEFMQLVLQKLQQVEHMVRQLFELSKMESVELVPQKEPFIFSEIMHEIINASAQNLAEKKIKFICITCQDTSWINADVGMMERVVQNLFVNAINYTPENGEIKITLQKESRQLIFQIENTGEPLNYALLQWINNAAETNLITNRPAKSGIGLMIVKKIINLHNYSFTAGVINGFGNQFTIQMQLFDLHNTNETF